MRTFLISQDLWSLVSQGYVEPDATAFAALIADEKKELLETRKKDTKALFTIQSRIDVTIFPKITECMFSKAAWDTLESAYKGSAKVRVAKLQMLRRDFESLQMGDAETIELFMNRVQNLVNALHSHGEELEATRIVEKVLRSLP